MSDHYLYVLLFYILNILKIVLPLAAIILSIIILTKKDKSAKLLALYCLLMSCSDLFGGFTAGMAMVSVQAYATASRSGTFLKAGFVLGALISVGIYAKRIYGSKANITVPCVYIGTVVIDRAVNLIAIYAAQGKSETELLKSLFVAMSISLVLGVIPYIILIRELYKNSATESRFPNLWKFMLCIIVAESLITVSWLLGVYEMIQTDAMSVPTSLLAQLSPLAPPWFSFWLAIYVLRHVRSKKEE